MRKRSLLIALFATGLVLLVGWSIAGKNLFRGHLTAMDSAKYERDILPEILALNSNQKYLPGKKFRAGHVTNAKVKNYAQKTQDGYFIKLPSTTNVPTPAILNGTIYLSGGFGSKEYYAFDASNGTTKWAITLDDDGPSSPAIDDGVIVFNTESCTIFGCDLITGRMVWSYWLGDPLMSMPTLANGIVFTAYPAIYPGSVPVIRDDTSTRDLPILPTHVLIAIELRTGKILWQKWIDSDVMSAPVAREDLLYVTTFSGALYKIKQESGEILEAKAIRATSAPVFHGNEIIISRRSDSEKDSVSAESIIMGVGGKKKEVYNKRTAYYLDKKTQSNARLKETAAFLDAGNGFSAGAPANSNWMAAEYNIGQSNVSSLQSFQGSRSVYQNGQLYNTLGDEIICTDEAGNLKWKYKLEGDLIKEGGFMGTPPVYANGHIIVATFTGEVLVIDEKEGKAVKKYRIENPVRYQPVVDKGWIYVTTTNGRMYAINTGNPLITGWNMWGGNAARTNTTLEK